MREYRFDKRLSIPPVDPESRAKSLAFVRVAAKRMGKAKRLVIVEVEEVN